MKRETLIEIILGTIGGLVFAIGMCMWLIPEWNMFAGGVVVSIIGFIILLAIIPVYRSTHPKMSYGSIDWKLLSPWIIGTIGSLIMGFGMSKIMTEDSSIILGLIFGIVGLIICVLNYPIHAYLKSNNK